ncbi:hypothetical protein OXIME_001100 [Oxyplasma meridianum]|uniref:DNA-binding protein n=1 Tax=Oxyplasma meridianum TaxID=3073602 RepID=A0AAX4NGR3_9ARCH
MADKNEIKSWLEKGTDDSKSLVGMKWKIEEGDNYMVLMNEKVPFVIYMAYFDNYLEIFMKTGIETAVMENQPRLAVYRSLLILNRQVDLVKFMIDGMNEEIVLRADFEISSFTREELEDALNILLSSMYVLVRTLKLEDQFNRIISERMFMMVQEMLDQGKSAEDVKNYLVTKVGLSNEDAEQVVNKLTAKKGGVSTGMYA